MQYYEVHYVEDGRFGISLRGETPTGAAHYMLTRRTVPKIFSIVDRVATAQLLTTSHFTQRRYCTAHPHSVVLHDALFNLAWRGNKPWPAAAFALKFDSSIGIGAIISRKPPLSTLVKLLTCGEAQSLAENSSTWLPTVHAEMSKTTGTDPPPPLMTYATLVRAIFRSIRSSKSIAVLSQPPQGRRSFSCESQQTQSMCAQRSCRTESKLPGGNLFLFHQNEPLSLGTFTLGQPLKPPHMFLVGQECLAISSSWRTDADL